MIAVIGLLVVAPTLIFCSGEGNIHLLENEVAFALTTCTDDNNNQNNTNSSKRSRRSNNNKGDAIRPIQCDDCRNSINDNIAADRNSLEIDNDSNSNKVTIDYEFQTTLNYTDIKTNRTKRSKPLLNTPDTEQCLSQCVFANLQVVDSRGIPREAELWNLVQSSITSQQSRAALRDQIRACFQELQSEAEDNGCSYSNKLERCLMLRFSSRLNDAAKKSRKSKN